MKRILYPLLASMVLFTQCKPEEQKVTKEELATFVAEIENGVLKRKPDILTSHIIMQALTDRMLKVKDIKNMSAISDGMKKGLRNSDLDKNVYGTIGNSGSFEKVKTYEKTGKQRAIFRIFGDGGINYLDMELTKLEGKVGIADMYVYATGENISKSMADLVTNMTEGVSDKKAVESAEAFQAIKRLMAKGNYTQAKKEFDRLPMFIKNSRIADIVNIQISSNLDEEIYLEEMEKFNSKYADVPSLQLATIDLHVLRKDYNMAIKSIDDLDALIDRDSFLDYYRGLITYAGGEPDKAGLYYKQVTQSNPQFAGAFEQLTALYLLKQDKQNAKLYFDKYKKLRNASPETISAYETQYPFLKD